MRVLVFGSSAERALSEHIAEQIGASAKSQAGEFRLGQLAGFIEHCDLFIAKRILEVNGVVAIASLASYKSNNPQEWVFINPPNSQLDNNIYLVRGPPILL